MKKLIYIFLLAVFSSAAQNNIAFNNQYTQPTWFGVSDAVFKNGNSYILFGASDYFNGNGEYYAISSMLVDLNGNYLSNKIIHNPVNNASIKGMGFNKIEKINNSQVLLSGQTLNSFSNPFYYGFPTLVKFNCNTGDTLWLKNYHQMGDSAQLYSSTMLTDSSIISFGTRWFCTAFTSYTSRPFMMKTDKHGNYKWHKWINGSLNIYSEYQKVIKMSDNDFIVLGSDDIDSTFALRIDTNAVMQYKTTLNGLGTAKVYDAITLHDGNILTVGYYYHPQLNGGNKFVCKFDPSTGIKITSRTYNKPKSADAAFCVTEKPDGTILVGGSTTGPLNTTVTTNNFQIADVLTLNGNLDSLCTQYIYNNYNNVISQGYASCMQITADNGYIATIRPMTSSHSNYFWLIKADSTNCSNSAPFVGIKTLNPDETEIKTYPNPVKDILNIQLNAAAGSKYQVKIINSLGQLIKNADILFENNNVQISTINFEGGLYILIISSTDQNGNTIKVTRKFMVEK